MLRSLKIVAAALAAAFVLNGASATAATTVNIGMPVVSQEVILPPGDEPAVFDFVAGQRLTVPEFALQANGFNESDIAGLAIGGQINGTDVIDPLIRFFPIRPGRTQFLAQELFGPFVLMANETFSVFVRQVAGVAPTTTPVALQLTFTATPVPLPAGGVLLLSALVAGGFAARRRSKAKALA